MRSIGRCSTHISRRSEGRLRATKRNGPVGKNPDRAVVLPGFLERGLELCSRLFVQFVGGFLRLQRHRPQQRQHG